MSTVVTLDIPADHAAFAGHFPGNPVVPGVVLLDEMLHSIASARGVAPEQCTIFAAKFPSAAHPGELLELAFAPGDNQMLRFTIRAADRVVASGTVSVPATAAASHDQQY